MVIQESCRGRGQTVRGCESEILEGRQTGSRKYEEMCQESCRGRGQEILGCESGILQWSQTGSTRKCVRNFAEEANRKYEEVCQELYRGCEQGSSRRRF